MFCLCFGMHYIVSFLVLQSSWRETESWLLWFNCLPFNVLWLFLLVPWVGLQYVILVFPVQTHYYLSLRKIEGLLLSAFILTFHLSCLWAVGGIFSRLLILRPFASYSLHFALVKSCNAFMLEYFKCYQKLVSMIRKFHNHTLQTNPWHREEELQNTNSHKTSGTSSLVPNRMIAKLERTLSNT